MAKKPKSWMLPPTRRPKSKVSDAVGAEVEAKANELVEKVLKPQHVKPPPKEPRFNHIIDLLTKCRKNGKDGTYIPT